MSKIKSYQHKLQDGSVLSVFSVDPDVKTEHIERIVLESKRKFKPVDFEALSKAMPLKATLDSIDDLVINPSDKVYTVPEQLMPYRTELEADAIKKGHHNGLIMVVNGEFGNPLTITKGGYFDFKATSLSVIPSDILPDIYPLRKTIAELLPEYNLNLNQIVRYLGIAYILRPNDGEELSFVQRAKNLGIAADCMALSGSTPPFDKRFFDKDFNFITYLKSHMAKEMNEEYRLEPNEFKAGKIYMIDDTLSIPFMAVEIVATPSTKELAKRLYGDKDIIKEHPVIYSISSKSTAIQSVVYSFSMFPSSGYVLDLLSR